VKNLLELKNWAIMDGARVGGARAGVFGSEESKVRELALLEIAVCGVVRCCAWGRKGGRKMVW
jgi:hypothetical protein